MKHVHIFLKAMAALLALSLLWGCKSGVEERFSSTEKGNQEDRPTLTVCMDMDIGGEQDSSASLITLLRSAVPELMGDFHVEVQSIPGMGTERETALTHMRIEALADQGPDLFLCRSPRARMRVFNEEPEEGLFRYPKALMDRKMFLPLDEYMEGAGLMEWDKLYPQIMEAGRSEEGQVILPLGWRVNVTLVKSEDCTLTETLPMTFEQMLESEDPVILRACWGNLFGDSLGTLADYAKDEPAFTQEELAAHLEGLRLNEELNMAEALDKLGMWAMPAAPLGRANAQLFMQRDPDYLLIPRYNREGGATAYISSFGAVSRGAKEPEAAFRVLDALLGKEAQQSSELLSYDYGLPVRMDLLQEEERVGAAFEAGGKSYESWYLSAHNYQQLQELAGQVNVADFYTPIHQELAELYPAYIEAGTIEERQKLVSEAYTTISMMLAES